MVNTKQYEEALVSQDIELKPCPFCGSKARLLGGSMAQETYGIWCMTGHHINGTMDKEKTITAWNTRTPSEGLNNA